MCLLMLAGLCLYSPAAHAEEATDACTYTVPKDTEAAWLTDERVLSRVNVPKGKNIVLSLPEMAAPTLYAVWYARPASLTLIEKDAAGQEIASRELTPASLYESYSLTPGCVQAELKAGAEGYSLSTLRVFDGPIDESLPCYDPAAPAEGDVLLICGEPHSMLEDFGALLPYCTEGLDLSVSVLFAHMGTRKELHEAVNALWEMGLHTAPLVGAFADDDINEYKNVVKKWTEKRTKEFLTACIRRVKPRIVLAGDLQGKEPRSRFTAEMTVESWKLASQQGQYPDSAAAYGVHTPDKLYTLSTAGGTTVDMSGLTAGGETLLTETARAAYRCFASRQMYHIPLQEKLTLSLQETGVGQDANKDSLLEHVDTAGLRQYENRLTPPVTPTPVPTDTPAPTDTPVPTDTPAPEKTAAPQTDPVPAETPVPPEAAGQLALEKFAGSPHTGTILIVGLLAAALLGAALYFVKRFYRKKLPVTALWALPLLIGLLTAVLAAYDVFAQGAMVQRQAIEAAQKATPVPTPVPTDTPAPTNIPAPTNTPAPTDTPAPTQTPAPSPTETPLPEKNAELTDFDRHFLNDGTTELVEKNDEEAGEWIYRSDILAVEITRKTITLDEEPLTYYAAHIYQREFDSFRPAFATDKKTGTETAAAQDMVKRYRAVLWITGDNIIHAEKEKKGVLIRNGRIYSKNRAVDTLALYSDTLSMEIVPKSRTAEYILSSGAENTYSFFHGPKLLVDGEIHKDAYRTTQKNPRCGVGQVAPGHFVAIVADGRQKGYSSGARLSQFAQLFKDEGCTLAFNLDGGVSTAMFFMGKMINRVEDNGKTGYEASWLRAVPDGLVWGYTNLPGYFEN